MVNGQLGFAGYQHGALDFVGWLTTVAGRIVSIDMVRAPDKVERALAHDQVQ